MPELQVVSKRSFKSSPGHHLQLSSKCPDLKDLGFGPRRVDLRGLSLLCQIGTFRTSESIVDGLVDERYHLLPERIHKTPLLLVSLMPFHDRA